MFGNSTKSYNLPDIILLCYGVLDYDITDNSYIDAHISVDVSCIISILNRCIFKLKLKF